MKPRFSFFAVAIVALAIGFAAASCDDDPTQPAEKPKLELVAPAGETLSLGAADTESEVRFLCTGKWTATFDAEGTAWLTVSPQEGKGASEVQTVALSMDRNTSGQSRQGVLTIRSAGTTPVEIKVTQAAGEAGEETFELLDPGQSRIEADPEGEQIELAFLSGAAWTAKASVPDWVEDKSWLTVSPTSGEGDAEVQTVLLTVKKIPGSESLSGTVTLASGERKIVVEVEQAAPSYYCELLDPEQSEIEVSAEGGDIQVYFRCNNTWLATTDNSVREWFSVMPPMGDPSEAASVTLSVKPNPTTEPREAVAQLIAGDFDKPLKIRVTQAGMTGPVEIIEFPDPVLKERLVQSYDTNGDGEIDTAEAKAVTTLSVTYAATKIENLEGL